MKKLRALLSRYVEPIQLGDAAPRPLPVDKIQAELQEVSRTSETYFGACVVMTMAAFLVALWATLHYAMSPETVKLTFGGLGAYLIVIVRTMKGLWREKVATDMVVALAASLDRDTLASIIAVLLKRL